MGSFLDYSTVLVKERVGLFKAANAYDLYEPTTGASIGTVQERTPGIFVKILKFTKYKRITPFTVDVMDESGQTILALRRGFALFRSTVQVEGPTGEKLGHFQQRLWSIGGKFEVFDSNEQMVAMVQGKWTGWEYKFIDSMSTNLATVSKKWAGAAKELFTSADVYYVSLEPQVSDPNQKKLVMAAAICIDMVLKEKQR